MTRTRNHTYRLGVRWTGNLGTGTSGYRDFSREHQIHADGKPTLTGSADPAFRGDDSAYNPEDLLVAALSACHMLWFLHLCAVRGMVVESYEDSPEGIMVEDDTGGGRFQAVTLRPRVTFRGAVDPSASEACHHEAHEKCFIANSVSFPVIVEPVR